MRFVRRVSEFACHDEEFEPGTADTVWLDRAGVEGWVVLTKDSKIRYRSNETEVLLAAKVRAFVLVSSNSPGPEMASVFVKALPWIRRPCARQSAPFIAHVHRSGHVMLKLPPGKPDYPRDRSDRRIFHLAPAEPGSPLDSRRSTM